MGIQHIGRFFKQLQKELGVSRQEFSKNICSERAIYAIEQGLEGVHIDIFQDLMAKYGLPCTYLPAFRDREEFSAFRDLTDALYYIKCWNLSSAYPLLLYLQSRKYMNSQMIYRRVQLAKLLLLLRSGTAKNTVIMETAKRLFEDANITPKNFEEHYPSAIEYQMLIAYAECLLYKKKISDARSLAERIINALTASNLPPEEKHELLGKAELVLAHILFAAGCYQEAEKTSSSGMERCVRHYNHDALPDLICWNALSQERLGNRALAKQLLNDLYSFLCLNYRRLADRIYRIAKENLAETDILPERKPAPQPDIFPFPQEDPDLVKQLLAQKPPVDCAYQLGDIIRDLRIQQNMTQAELADGLCDRSQLSKIEKGQFAPVRTLAGALLERLGLRPNNFSFFTTKQDYEFSELNYNYTLYNLHNEYAKLSEPEDLLRSEEEKSNRLMRQSALLLCSSGTRDRKAQLARLEEGLACTFQGSWESIHTKKGLTYNESSFFINFLQCYNSMGEHEKALALAVQLINFHSHKTYEPDARWRVFEPVTYFYIFAQYNLGNYAEVDKVVSGLSKDLPLNDLSNPAYIYFFSCQALIHLNRSTEEVLTYANAAAAAFRLLGNQQELDNFRKMLLEEYGLRME